MKKFFSVAAAVLLTAVLLAPALFTVGANAAGTQTVLGVNAINVGGAEGHSLIVTHSFMKTLSSSAAGFSWWRSVTFEWSDDDGAYIVRSIDLTADGSNGKNNYVPENGFVLTVNIGNDYGNINYINTLSSNCFYDLEKISVGDKAYLAGIDLAKGKIETSGGKYYLDGFTSDAKIYIGEKPEGVEIYAPDTSKSRLSGVNVSADNMVTQSQGVTVTWEPVENAEYYIVNVNTSTFITDGTLIVNNQKVTDTTFIVPSNKLTTGNKYTVSVAACAEGYRSSYNTRTLVSVVSDRAADSKFADKKIVAFGDSITYIPGWVAMLDGELGTELINAGVSGDKTTEAIARIDKDVIALDPDIVLVMFGMNDQAIYQPTGKPLVSLKDYEKNLRMIIEKLHDCGAEVVLMTGDNVCTASGYYVAGLYNLDYGTGNLTNYYDVMRKLAGEYNLNLIDMNKMIADEGIADSVICAPGDGIHLSTAGKAKYAGWIADYMYDDYFEGGFVEAASADTSAETSADTSAEISAEAVSGDDNLSQDVSEQSELISDLSEQSAAEGESSAAENESSAAESESSAAEEASSGDKALVIGITVVIFGVLIYLSFGKSKKE